MKTHLEFTSTAFSAYPGEDKEINPGIFGNGLPCFWLMAFVSASDATTTLIGSVIDQQGAGRYR